MERGAQVEHDAADARISGDPADLLRQLGEALLRLGEAPLEEAGGRVGQLLVGPLEHEGDVLGRRAHASAQVAYEPEGAAYGVEETCEHCRLCTDIPVGRVFSV